MNGVLAILSLAWEAVITNCNFPWFITGTNPFSHDETSIASSMSSSLSVPIFIRKKQLDISELFSHYFEEPNKIYVCFVKCWITSSVSDTYSTYVSNRVGTVLDWGPTPGSRLTGGRVLSVGELACWRGIRPKSQGSTSQGFSSSFPWLQVPSSKPF